MRFIASASIDAATWPLSAFSDEITWSISTSLRA